MNNWKDDFSQGNMKKKSFIFFKCNVHFLYLFNLIFVLIFAKKSKKYSQKPKTNQATWNVIFRPQT